jgi:toxin ParE1/3/4
MAEYRLAPAAERDLETIWLYTRRQWGVDQADRYIGILTASFPSWRSHPKPLLHATIFDQAIDAEALNGT